MSKKGTNNKFIINDNITKTITLNLQEFSLIQSLCETDLEHVNYCLLSMPSICSCTKDNDYLEKKKFLIESIILKIKETPFDK